MRAALAVPGGVEVPAQPRSDTARLRLQRSCTRVRRATLKQAEEDLQGHGHARRIKNEDVKRVYGLGLTYLALARKFDQRARFLREGKRSAAISRRSGSSRRGEQVRCARRTSSARPFLEIDAALEADRKILAPQRISASLAPDAHIGMAWAEIMMATREDLTHLASRRGITSSEFAKHRIAVRESSGRGQRERILVTDPLHEDRRARSRPTSVST